jgi:glyoxylase-like metal-dependent hydrolase (beta-lactamase superfamily II)
MIARQVESAGTQAAINDLGEGVWQFQSPLWQTNSVLALAEGEAMLCDAALAPDEIAGIRSEVERRAEGPLHVLITHGDFDHVCGIPYFADAEVVAGDETAQRVESGTAADDLRAAGAEWGLEWPTDGLRVDRTVAAAGEFWWGAFQVAAVDAPSHGREGLGFVLLEQGVLLPGDHLSAITYPLLAGSPQRAMAACERLIEALGRFELRWVVPGHGPALSQDEARAIAEADLAYLVALAEAAREAVAEVLSPGAALVHVFAVEPPRANTDDFEIYAIHAGNARLMLAEVESEG